jgi:hypothetical protein
MSNDSPKKSSNSINTINSLFAKSFYANYVDLVSSSAEEEEEEVKFTHPSLKSNPKSEETTCMDEERDNSQSNESGQDRDVSDSSSSNDDNDESALSWPSLSQDTFSSSSSSLDSESGISSLESDDPYYDDYVTIKRCKLIFLLV